MNLSLEYCRTAGADTGVVAHDYMIQCGACGHLNDTGVEGCTRCGTALVPFCAKCRRYCGPDDRYCSGCGGPVKLPD